MSPSAIDRSELENRLRDALQTRAKTTRVVTPDHFEPRTPALVVDLGRRRRRTTLLVGAAASVAGLVVAAALLTRDDDVRVTTGGDGATGTAETSGGEGNGVGDAVASATAVDGPSGSRWFVLELPGVSATGGARELGAGGDAAHLQAFRTDAGFAGPVAWVESAGEGYGFGEDAPGVTEVTVQGRTAYLHEDGDRVTLGRPGIGGDGFSLVAVGLSADEVVTMAEGLRARADGDGWDATELPGGLAEIPVDEVAVADAEHAEWSYTGPDDANYELFVNPGGAGTFEQWAREHVASGGSVEPISVDGRPGVIIGGDGESVAVWRATDEVVVDFRTSGSRDDLIAAMTALRPVEASAWLDHFPPDARPDPPTAPEG